MARGQRRGRRPTPTTWPTRCAWGRAWQAQAGRRRVGRASTGPPSTAAGARRRSRWRIFNAEYARSGAPQLVNRVGINLAGPDAAGPRDRRAVPAVAAGHRRRAEEIWCQLFSEPGAGSDLSGLVDPGRARSDGGLAGERPEGVDLVRAVRPLRAVPGPHRAGDDRARGACRCWWWTWRHPASTSAPSCRSPARPSSTRSSSTRSSCPPTIWWGRPGRAGRWRRRPWRTSGARTSRSKRRWCTRAT